MSLVDSKYKDDLPIRTINRIRGILGELGLLTIETVWRNSVEGFYSVSIAIENTDLSTNGKGASYQYALASAYGEMMERLQNQCNFRLSMDFKPETLQYKNFYYAPDEVSLSIDDIMQSSEDWITWQMSRLEPAEDKRALLKLWQLVSYEDVPGDFIALPYCNLSNGQISHIPIKMVSKMYMSNGMCAGNTPEEALVQGISEILERHVNKTVIKDKVVPPSIPRDYLAQFPRLNAMIDGIEASGDFEVIMKDCSLGQGLPVVGVIFINKSDQSYFVKFGAHPIFEIAAERTLTELLQGQEIKRMMGVREFSYINELYRDPENVIGILVNGSGVYPTEFFSNHCSYPFQEFVNMKETSNKAMLSYLVCMLKDNGFNIFVKDVSFLGFPSFHIIIPGLSEIEEFNDKKTIIEYAEYNKARKLVRNIANLDQKDAADIIGFLRKIKYTPASTIMDLLNLPVRGNTFPWYYSNVDLFITALYYWQQDMPNAYNAFLKFLTEKEFEARKNGSVTYYKCVRDYIGTHVDGLATDDAFAMLATFYPLDIVQGVINEFGNPQNILSYLGQLNCWNCSECPFNKQCLYQSTEKVYLLLKEQYAANQPKTINLYNLIAE